MKKTPPPLDLPDSYILSTQKTEKDSVRQMTWSGTRSAIIPSDKKILQSLMSHWNRILAPISSDLFSRDWTLARRTLGRGGRCAWTLSLCCFLVCFPGDTLPLLLLLWLARTISAGHSGLMSNVSQNLGCRPKLMSRRVSCMLYCADTFVQKKKNNTKIQIQRKRTISTELPRQWLDILSKTLQQPSRLKTWSLVSPEGLPALVDLTPLLSIVCSIFLHNRQMTKYPALN